MTGDGAANLDVSSDLPASSGERAITEFHVLNAESLFCVSLQPLPELIGQRSGDVVAPLSLDTADDLSQGEDREDQNGLRHNLSFDSLTSPPDG